MKKGGVKQKRNKKGKNNYFSPPFPNKMSCILQRERFFWTSIYCNYWKEKHMYSLLEPQHYQPELLFCLHLPLISLWHKRVSQRFTQELVTSLARSGRSLVSLECSSHNAIPILATASHGEWKGKEPSLGVLPRMGVWRTESFPTSFCSECLGPSTLFCPFMVTRMFIPSPEK